MSGCPTVIMGCWYHRNRGIDMFRVSGVVSLPPVWVNSVVQPLVGSGSNSLKAMQCSVPVPCALPSLGFVPWSHRLSWSCLCLKPPFTRVGRRENCCSVMGRERS